MSLRWPLIVGVSIGLAAVGGAWATATLSDGGDGDGNGLLTIFVAVVVLFGSTAVTNLVAGVFGRDHEWGLLAALGTTSVLLVAVGIVIVTTGAAAIVPGLTFVAAAGVVVAAVARASWFVGDRLCSVTGHATAADLAAPAFPEPDGPTPWTTAAAGQITATVRSLEGRLEDEGAVVARAIGVQHRVTWHRPLAVLVAERSLLVAALGLDGRLAGESDVIARDAIVEVRFRSEPDGGPRREINAFDDLIELADRRGRRWRFTLPYSSTDIGDGDRDGSEAVRSWLRRRRDDLTDDLTGTPR